MKSPSAVPTTIVALTVLCLALTGDGLRAQHQDGSHAHDAPKAAPAATQPFQGDPYLLDIDSVSGDALGPVATQVIVQHEGREFRFSSAENAAAFKQDPAKYIPAVDARMIAQQLPYYPLATCAVSGEPLAGESMRPMDFIYKNRLVRFCCADCKPTFLADPAKVVAQLDSAVIAAQGKQYPTDVCLVSGEKLGGDMGAAIEQVFGNRLVRFCCKDCVKTFRKEPLVYLAKLGAPGRQVPDPKAEQPGEHEHGEHGHDDGR